MRALDLNQKDKKFLYWSIAGHVGLALILTVRIYLFPADRDFVRSVRVDLVALPDKNPKEGRKAKKEAKKEAPKKTEPKKTKPKPKKPKVKPKPKPKKKGPSIKKTKSQQSNALARLKALQKIKEKAGKAKDDSAVYKGNALSKGTALTGVEKLQHDRYSEELDQHIKKYWELPAFLENSDQLRIVLIVKINADGVVTSKTVIQKSGNHVFDQRAIQAIERAIPLPKPPESLTSYLKFRGIELRFPE